MGYFFLDAASLDHLVFFSRSDLEARGVFGPGRTWYGKKKHSKATNGVVAAGITAPAAAAIAPAAANADPSAGGSAAAAPSSGGSAAAAPSSAGPAGSSAAATPQRRDL